MGCYDTVHFKCPKCGFNIEEQSKGGVCYLRDYSAHSVPLDVAGGIVGETVYCSSCETPFRISKLTNNRVSLVLTDYEAGNYD